ncbi:sulfite exporter TauE/SafE family protein [Myxococcus sp. K38C18041901]|uniref:sulfite exporter TauE/SafE family protein n=1 Tax=Myxococcus guangdongensis TaxID=2906760 RepID=UPI0020A7680D|nr:sulfite exporter TauE/SafE family protein [Myxococcus guangdongensis]MCP3063252.1 sulfite exporter TauE/SafE family protein [Myxococcus guangdongensis]
MMWAVGMAGALLVGVLLGLLGGGGSILTVPLLVYVLGVEPRTAIAMSLVVVGVTSASGALLHARAGRVKWRTALLFGTGGMAGAFLGGKLNPLLSPTLLLLCFAGVMVAASVAMLLRSEAPTPTTSSPVTADTRGTSRVTSEPPGASEPRIPGPLDRPARSTRLESGSSVSVARVVVQGVGVGILSGLVGAGGGFLIVPALTLVGLSTPMATATSLVVIALQCAAGLVGHLGHIELPWRLTSEVLAIALMGSMLGGRFAGRVAPGVLRRGFALFVLATATFLLLAQLPPTVHTYLGQRLSNAGAWPWLILTTTVGLSTLVVRKHLRTVRQRTTVRGL